MICNKKLLVSQKFYEKIQFGQNKRADSNGKRKTENGHRSSYWTLVPQSTPIQYRTGRGKLSTIWKGKQGQRVFCVVVDPGVTYF